MNLLEQLDELRSTFAFWQVFRSLGFESADLYVGIVNGRMIVEVRQEGQPYAISMGRTRMTQEEFEPLWLELSESLPKLPLRDLKANYEKWVTQEYWDRTVMALVMAGVKIPARQHTTN